MFTSRLVLASLGLLASVASGFDCSKKEFADFNFEKLKGLHHISVIEDTPPSVSNFTWFINVCDAIEDNDRKQYEGDLKDCPKDSQICGIEYISILGAEPIKTKVISFSNALNPVINSDKEFKNPKNNEKTSSVEILIGGANWGSKSVKSDIQFVCDKNVDDNKDNDKENIQFKSWENNTLKIQWFSSSLCTKGNGDKDKKPDKEKPDDKKDKNQKKSSSSFGFFNFIFNVFALIGLIYLVGGIWLTVSRRGESPLSFNETINEITEILVDVGRSVPGFIREVFDRIFGSSASRGGYSAV